MNDEKMNLENTWNSLTPAQAATKALRSIMEKQAEYAAQEQLEKAQLENRSETRSAEETMRAPEAGVDRIDAQLADVRDVPTTPQDDTSGEGAQLEFTKSKANTREVNAIIAVPLMLIAGLLGMMSLIAVVVGGGESIFELLGLHDDPVAKALGQTREFDWTMHMAVFFGGLAILPLSAGIITYYLKRLEEQDRNR